MNGQAVEIEEDSLQDRIDAGVLNVCKAGEENRQEILTFLSERSIHTFGLAGKIVTNGVISPNNRGSIYTFRNQENELEGVALLGYDNLFEVRSDRAIQAFAELFRKNRYPHLLMGEEEKINRFCHHYRESEPLPSDSHRYILFKQSWPIEVCEPIDNLRPATLEDLDLVVQGHAQACLEDTGINSMEQDPKGFTRRCVNRITNQKTWIWVKQNKLIFKVEIVTATPDVHYLESVWIDPEERKKGYGFRCLTQLGRHLLQHTSAVCLLASELNIPARRLYEKVGYKNLGYYRVLFFPQQTAPCS
jgi:predicted GNAT family acetyltransferase